MLTSKCYVGEHQRGLDTFVLEAYKVLKSLTTRVGKFMARSGSSTKGISREEI